MEQEIWRKLISGRAEGFAETLLLRFLRAVSKIYALIIKVRNLLYTTGLLRVHRVKPLVISIGNITTGGTGKTPMTVWLYNYLAQKHPDCPIAVLTRGYKAGRTTNSTGKNYSDEPAVLQLLCPKGRVIVNPDRVSGAKEAIEQFKAKILIADDCFQHRRLARDIDIVMIDATMPFGFAKSPLTRLGAAEQGRLLPAGFLREPLEQLKRAHAVILTRSDQVTSLELKQAKGALIAENPEIIIAESIHAPVTAKALDGLEITLDQLKDKKIFAFCAIGNPHAFFTTIKQLEAKLVGSKIFDDHYHYTEADINAVFDQAYGSGAQMILTTHKDWTRTVSLTARRDGITFAYLQIEIKIISNEEKITQLIDNALRGKITG